MKHVDVDINLNQSVREAAHQWRMGALEAEQARRMAEWVGGIACILLAVIAVSLLVTSPHWWPKLAAAVRGLL